MTAVASMVADLMSRAPSRDLYTGEGARLYAATVADDPAEVAELRALAERAGRGLDVVELAAGEGRLLLSLPLDRGDRRTAVDTSAVLLGALSARARAQQVPAESLRTIQADILEWSPPPASIDLLILGAGSARLFNPDQRATLFEAARRSLRPDGLFHVSTADPEGGSEQRLTCLGEVRLGGRDVVAFFFARRLPDAARETGFIVVDKAPAPASPRVYRSTVHDLTADDLRAELAAAGLRVVEERSRRIDGPDGTSELVTCLAATPEAR